jgi:hypothetical protein
MQVRSAVVIMSLLVLHACGGASAPSIAPSTATLRPAMPSAAPPSVAPPTSKPSMPAPATSSTAVDLSQLDACTLIDEETVRELTGTSLDFVTGQGDHLECFWGATVPEPPYVEIEVFPLPNGLSAYNFNPTGCTTAPVAGVGTEAKGATCSNPQHKVYLLAWDRGVALQVLVNEPSRPLEPDDLAASVAAALEAIQ